MTVLGIDLGTCYSCVAKCEKKTGDIKEHIEVITPINSNIPTVPSIVSLEKDTPLVGWGAKNNMVAQSKNCFSFVKREMSKEYLEQELSKGVWDTRKVSPAEIQACILRYMFHNANKVIKNTDRQPEATKAVITIPAIFNDTEREKTKLAAQMAGIDVLALIQEPTAAAIAYNIHGGETILVFDLGGGTLDVSIVKNDYGNHKVLGVPAGNPKLGGKDWDEALVNHLLRKQGKSLSDYPRSSKEWARLMKTAEEVKQALTDQEEAFFETANPPISETISRSEFEKNTIGLVQQAMTIVDEAIENAGSPTIDRFVLVGGSSRMPMIKRSIQQKYESTYSRGRKTDEWLVVSDPDQAIAKGAAIYAGVLEGLVNRTIHITDYATHSYGFRCYRTGTDILIVLNEILKSDPIEIHNKRFSLFTRYENQSSIATTIIENNKTEYEYEYNNDPILIEKDMPLPPNIPKGSEIFYILNRDKNGIIDVHVECQGRELQFKAKEIASESIMRQIEKTIQKMKEAEQ